MMMRSRLNIAAVLAASLLLSQTGASPFGLTKDSRRDRKEDDDGPQLTSRDRLELDLWRAEEQLAEARTPGAQRKARRKVRAIRVQLGMEEL